MLKMIESKTIIICLYLSYYKRLIITAKGKEECFLYNSFLLRNKFYFLRLFCLPELILYFLVIESQ